MIFRSWKSWPRRPCNRADLEPKRFSSQGSPTPAHATGTFLQTKDAVSTFGPYTDPITHTELEACVRFGTLAVT